MSFEIFVMNFMVNETINIQRTCMHICMDMENRICDINLGLGIYIRVSVKITNIIYAQAQVNVTYPIFHIPTNMHASALNVYCFVHHEIHDKYLKTH